MRIERDARAGGPIVTGFGPGGFRIGEESHPALLLTIERAVPWAPPLLDRLAITDMQPLVDAAPEFVLLGTGASLLQPPIALIRALEANGIGLEIMDSRAAGRAWGVLRGEGRAVGAALYPLL